MGPPRILPNGHSVKSGRWAGQYYPLGITGTVPRAYDMCRAYEGMKGRKNKNKEMKNMKM
jgi:hypothetical protein